MTKDEHIKIHKELHKNLDILIADYVTCTGKSLSSSSILDLIYWSYNQTINPIER